MVISLSLLQNSIRHTLSLNTAFCKMGNPYNLEAKKGFLWIVNPKYQVYLDTEIAKFLKIQGRKLIENPDASLFEEPLYSPAITPKKQKMMKSSTPKARKATSSEVSLSTMDISKSKPLYNLVCTLYIIPRALIIFSYL